MADQSKESGVAKCPNCGMWYIGEEAKDHPCNKAKQIIREVASKVQPAAVSPRSTTFTGVSPVGSSIGDFLKSGYLGIGTGIAGGFPAPRAELITRQIFVQGPTKHFLVMSLSTGVVLESIQAAMMPGKVNSLLRVEEEASDGSGSGSRSGPFLVAKLPPGKVTTLALGRTIPLGTKVFVSLDRQGTVFFRYRDLLPSPSSTPNLF